MKADAPVIIDIFIGQIVGFHAQRVINAGPHELDRIAVTFYGLFLYIISRIFRICTDGSPFMFTEKVKNAISQIALVNRF